MRCQALLTVAADSLARSAELLATEQARTVAVGRLSSGPGFVTMPGPKEGDA